MAGDVPRRAGRRVSSADGIDYIFSGLPVAFFNVTILTQPSIAVSNADAECATLLDINSAAYEMDLEPVKAVLGKQTFWNDHVAVLGSVDDVPASGAAVLMVDGCRHVALVATAPAHRRRGYAEAVMRRAFAVAASAHGERPTCCIMPLMLGVRSTPAWGTRQSRRTHCTWMPPAARPLTSRCGG